MSYEPVKQRQGGSVPIVKRTARRTSPWAHMGQYRALEPQEILLGL